MNDKSKVINQPLAIIMGECFGRYAKYIIQDRAIPDARDGLKPVQRRILYAMYELGLTSDKPYKKSARTVGEVIGKYHPHGDSSIYEAMVRMSQDWKNNLPLLDMHGNNGSIDGDSAAAMRYTESKLSEVANIMIGDIRKDTVEFTYNFDDSEKEPTVLPALLPNLVINGAVGIAAGYATNIPPHNPTEVFNAIIHLIDFPDANLDRIMQILPAPDFPTGAIIEGKSGIKDAFATGRGKFIISSKIVFNTEHKKVDQLIVTEIPYDTPKSIIIKELNEILYEEKIGGILEVRDESDKNGVCIVIDVKKDSNLGQIKNYLLKNTHLQINYSVNFVTIVDRKPVLLPIIDALKHYIVHALNIQRRIWTYELNKNKKRLEIVNGLILAINNIDEVIRIIRASESKDSAKQGLIERFGITEVQAEAIVVLRLYRLTRTDIGQLLVEADDLMKTIHRLEALLNSEELQKQELKQQLMGYRDQYGYPRKTEILEEVTRLDVNESEILDVKEMGVLISRDGYIKAVTKKQLETNNVCDAGVKPLDMIITCQGCMSNQILLIVTQQAKTLAIPVYKLKVFKWKEVGDHINSYMTISPNDKIVFATVVDHIDDNDGLILMSKAGMNKKISLLEAFNTKQIKGSSCFKLKPDDALISAHLIHLSDTYFVYVVNNLGVGYCFSSAEIPELTKTASGVKSMRLKPSEYVLGCGVAMTQQLLWFTVAENGYRLNKLSDFKISSRTSVGRSLFNVKKEKLLTAFIVARNTIVDLLNDEHQTKSLKMSEVGLDLAKFTKVTDNKSLLDATIDKYNSVELREDVTKADVLPSKKAVVDDSEISLLDSETHD